MDSTQTQSTAPSGRAVRVRRRHAAHGSAVVPRILPRALSTTFWGPVPIASCFAVADHLFGTFLLLDVAGHRTPFAFFLHQQIWRPSTASVVGFLANAWSTIHIPMIPWNFVWLNIAAVILTLAAAIASAGVRKSRYVLFLLVPPVVLLSTGTFLSAARILMVLFPIYFWLGRALGSVTCERFTLAMEVSLLTLMTLMYGLLATAGMT